MLLTCELRITSSDPKEGGGGGNSHIKRGGVLVVSLRGCTPESQELSVRKSSTQFQ